MSSRRPPSVISAEGISTDDLARGIRNWILDCQARQLSKQTIEGRVMVTDRLLWYLRTHQLEECGVQELRHFFAYLAADPEPGRPRWDCEVRFNQFQVTRRVRPGTVATFYARLRTLFAFLLEERYLDTSPFGRLKAPPNRQDQVQPFTRQEVEALLLAAERSPCPLRNCAIILLALDTGLRASEICGLRLADVDPQSRRLTVVGKGNKRRTLIYSRHVAKALMRYLADEAPPDDEKLPLFLSETRHNRPLTTPGLRTTIARIGRAAGVTGTRCSPHTLRHTFAIEFLRAGGNVFTLKAMLGHESLDMTNRYVQIAQADLDEQHRLYSPVEALMKRK